MTDEVQKIREEVARLQKRAEHNFDTSLTENERQFWLGESNVLTLIEKYIDTVQEDPVSNDLEETASRYAKEEYSRKNPATLPDRCVGCYAPIMYAFRNGANWQKDQMMAKGIEGTVRPDDNEIWCNLSTFNFKDGDKCKVVLIKED